MRSVLACTLALAIVWYAVLDPMRAETLALEKRLESSESVIERARVNDVALPALEQELRQLDAALEPFHESADLERDANGLISDLQAMTADAQLRITGLKPRSDLIRGEGVERALELSIEGSYHNVGRFLGRLSSSARLLTTPEVSVRAAGNGGDRTSAAGSVAVVEFELRNAASDELTAYDPGGRPDPFENLTPPKPAAPAVAGTTRGRGLAAVSLTEIAVRGVARDQHQKLAIIETSVHQSFVVRTSDRLADAVVHDIDASGVTFLQHDGRLGPSQVHKPVRPTIGGRP